MNNDPRKTLAQLEKQLQAVEKTDDDFERLYSELYKEFGQKPAEEAPAEDLLKGIPVRRIPGPYDEPVRRSDYADQQRSARRKDNTIGKLVLLICLECLGIAGIVAWWLFRLL